MKKFIVLTLFGLLIMAFSATVYAQKLDFKASGFIDAQSEYWVNVTPVNANVGAGIYNVVSPTYQPGGAAYDKKNAYGNPRQA